MLRAWVGTRAISRAYPISAYVLYPQKEAHLEVADWRRISIEDKKRIYWNYFQLSVVGIYQKSDVWNGIFGLVLITAALAILIRAHYKVNMSINIVFRILCASVQWGTYNSSSHDFWANFGEIWAILTHYMAKNWRNLV